MANACDRSARVGSPPALPSPWRIPPGELGEVVSRLSRDPELRPFAVDGHLVAVLHLERHFGVGSDFAMSCSFCAGSVMLPSRTTVALAFREWSPRGRSHRRAAPHCEPRGAGSRGSGWLRASRRLRHRLKLPDQIVPANHELHGLISVLSSGKAPLSQKKGISRRNRSAADRGGQTRQTLSQSALVPRDAAESSVPGGNEHGIPHGTPPAHVLHRISLWRTWNCGSTSETDRTSPSSDRILVPSAALLDLLDGVDHG